MTVFTKGTLVVVLFLAGLAMFWFWLMPGRYYYPLIYWIDLGLQTVIGMIPGAIGLFFLGGCIYSLRDANERRKLINELGREWRESPVKLAYNVAFFISALTFMIGLSAAFLGWEPVIPFIDIRAWLFGIIAVAVLMVVGFIAALT